MAFLIMDYHYVSDYGLRTAMDSDDISNYESEYGLQYPMLANFLTTLKVCRNIFETPFRNTHILILYLSALSPL